MGLFSGKNNKNKKEKQEEKQKEKSTKSLAENIGKIKALLNDCGDIVYKEFRVGEEQKLEFQLIYTDGMIDKTVLDEAVLNPVMVHAREVPPDAPKLVDKLYELVRYGTIPASELREIDNIDDAILAILTGDAVLLIDGTEKIIQIGAKGWPARSVGQPNTEAVIRGPRDGFTETYRANTALVRRRIRDSKLKLRQVQVGTRSHTDIGIFYIEDVAQKELLDEVVRRLKTINIDAIVDSGYIEQLIEDNYLSPFPQTEITERPDAVAAALLEGRVAIMVDNSPFAIIVPTSLNSLFQSPEDYYDRWIIASTLRFVRYAAGILSVMLPAIYIAVTSYHPGILPTKLVLSIAASREGVPFPAIIEAILMETTFELLREAGIRLPVLIGSIIGIVGGLVIGQSAVSAGIVSPIMVIIVAVTAISSFSIPNYSLANAFRWLRFALMILAGMFGLYGLVLGGLIILSHLAKLKSFGMSYLTPFTTLEFTDMKDTFIRVPTFLMINRPSEIAKNRVRMKNNRHMINQLESKGDDSDDEKQ